MEEFLFVVHKATSVICK